MTVMIRRRIPPLNALKAFESAARHCSFTVAGEEIHVTQAAISHQIKLLEDWLGAPLFLRSNRMLILTPEGKTLAKALTTSLDMIASGIKGFIEDTQETILSISAFDSIASLWLLPKLEAFQSLHPNIQVRVVNLDHFSDFISDNVDVEIRYGNGNWPNLHYTKLCGEDIFPVCAPAILEKFKGRPDLDDLLTQNLLHDVMVMDWASWLEQAGLKSDAALPSSLQFNHSHLVVQSAINGQGVALGRGALVADALASGSLVRFGSTSVRSPYAYYLVAPMVTKGLPKVEHFVEWIKEKYQDLDAATTP